MSKFIEDLKAKFSFCSNLVLQKVRINKLNNSISLFLKAPKVLDIDSYFAVVNYIDEFFSKKLINVKTNIYYEDSTLDEESFEKYFIYIIKMLIRYNVGYNIFLDVERNFSNNEVTFIFEKDAVINDDYIDQLSTCFSDYGLNININISASSCSLEELAQKAQEESIMQYNDQRVERKQIYENTKNLNLKKTRRKYPLEPISIKEIPLSKEALDEYVANVDLPYFTIRGSFFANEASLKTKKYLGVMRFSDDTDSIIVKKWLNEADLETYNKYTSNDILEIKGEAKWDNFSKQIVIMAEQITYYGKKEEKVRLDEAPVKRVELHAHTKMSNLDSVSSATDYYNALSKWGHKAFAVTDHDGMYANPEIDHLIASGKYDIKPMFGVELSYVDDSKAYDIAFSNEDILLNDATYVVFDLETTGFSQEDDRIIEIAAVKVEHGMTTDTYETFVNPEMPISEKITNLTSITDDMVAEAPTIKEALPELIKFCEGAILVAHNARFDVGMLNANIDRLRLKNPNWPVIDTLNALRAMYSDKLKRYNLKAMCNLFKIKQEHHHRAIDDTRVTALCFLRILNDMYAKQIDNYNQINTLADPEIMWKQVIPTHINLLAKNQTGFRKMYSLLSDSLTTHYKGSARLLKSLLEKSRYDENGDPCILVGSGCVNGLVFETALNGNLTALEDYIKFYDYIEIQPLSAYAQLFEDITGGREKVIATIKKIIAFGKSLGKPVVATSDCHYLDKEQKQYRDILINSMQVGGGRHQLARYDVTPDMHLRTTQEMLEEFSFLDDDLAYEIVVENTNKIADEIEKFEVFHPVKYRPRDDQFKDSLNVPSIEKEFSSIVEGNIKRIYGDNPHPIVRARADFEEDTIIGNGYASIYYISHLLVKKSLSEGYLVGSRGSVGSSFAATMMQITEINPLPPHYVCPHCKWHTFRLSGDGSENYQLREDELPFQKDLNSVDTGFDLPDAVCPICGAPLKKDGQTIPFETFLGIGGKKTPDIDLNFSGEYQPTAHEYIRSVFGPNNAFRAGTVQTVADKNAYGYVKAYIEKKNIKLRDPQIDKIAQEIVGVRRSTGQHPGGIIVVPNWSSIYDVTPVQFPANNTESVWKTTHYDYHSFEENLLKFDILGHDDPTMIKYLMDYVHLHPENYPFTDALDIPITDKKVLTIFNSTSALGVTPEQIDSKIGVYGIPEFGTRFVYNMLLETRPKTFDNLVKISGLSHGTDVWANNAKELIAGKTEFSDVTFDETIGCRDDIMVYLQHCGLSMEDAFSIMELVRKGKVAKFPDKWAKYKELLKSKNVPDWYIWSCEQIKYMFPKAHACAYVVMALRIAWFKVYSPALFYSAYFSKRAKAHSIESYIGGSARIREEIRIRNVKKDQTAKDQDLVVSLQIALEATERGVKFLPIDINKSSALNFTIEDGNLRIPFVACDGLGESAALDIVQKREEEPFTSIEDVLKRTKLNKSLKEEFLTLGFFGDLALEEEEKPQGLFALL